VVVHSCVHEYQSKSVTLQVAGRVSLTRRSPQRCPLAPVGSWRTVRVWRFAGSRRGARTKGQTSDGEALIEGREIRVLGPLGSMRELGQDRPEQAIALAGFARALLPRTCIIPWCHTGPFDQARRGLKARHIDPDLRHDHFHTTLIDPGNRVQEFDSTGSGMLAAKRPSPCYTRIIR
jgi:hypothetical protein